MKAKNGFTLVEILIVVVILGILAAMVIPVFGQASTDAKTSALASNLMKMRLQIELYRNHHNGQYPGSGTATFEQAMTGKTTLAGAVGGTYGPYVERLPMNSFNGQDTVRTVAPAAGANTDGWHLDVTTGDFRADDSAEHAQNM
ncbi:MAG: type II secretion system protein [Sedimentisphaerales bacterium]|nr:type II secretion system protein [Sedimentisphaerales bacterium]